MDSNEQLSRLMQALAAGTVSRRTFLKGLTWLSVNGVTNLAFTSPLKLANFVALLQPANDVAPDYKLAVVRPDDLLLLQFDFYGARLIGNRIERIGNAAEHFMVVNFPPQHIVEEVGLETEVDGTVGLFRQLAAGPPAQYAHLYDTGQQRLLIMRASLSGPSRIAFSFPEVGIDFSLSALLNWAGLIESVSAVRNTTDEQIINATVLAPNAHQTALEMPTYITLVPDPGTALVPTKWLPRNTTPLLNGRSPLWHVKRTLLSQEGVADEKNPTRLFFASSPFIGQGDSISLPVATALTPHDIDKVIEQFNGSSNQYLRAENVMLSALGGWLKLRDVSDGKTGEKWIHNMTMGRDQFVRIVNEGFLFPFGHRAARISVSERKFIFQSRDNSTSLAPDGQHTTSDAYLLKREFIIIREAERDYEAIASGFPHQLRELPFKRIRILTEVTPLLTPGTFSEIATYWPMTGVPGNSHLIEFQIEAIDKNDARISFQMPLLFVPGLLEGTVPSQENLVKSAISKYDKEGDNVSMRGQKVAFIPMDPGKPATNPNLVTNYIRFGGQLTNPLIQGSFLPLMRQAQVRIPELGQIKGHTQDVVKDFKYADIYLTQGFPNDQINNKQEVFAEFVDDLVQFQIPAERMGIATPSLSLDGLSRLLGPVPFAKQLSNPDPALAIPFLDGNLFGGLKLSAIMPILKDALGKNFNSASYTTINNLLRDAGAGNQGVLSDILFSDNNLFLDVPVFNVQEPTETNKFTRTSFVLKPHINELAPLLKIKSSSNEDINIKLVVLVTVITPVDGTEPEYHVAGKLKDFAIEVLKIVRLEFSSFSFTMTKGKGTDVKPELSSVVFLDALAFLNALGDQLRDALKSNENNGPGGGNGGLVSFDIQAALSDIRLTMSLTIPPLGLGVFTLANLKLTVGLVIPFDPSKKVSLIFRVAERNDPFTVAVTLFGGTGFFGMELDLDGKIKVLEAAIEFGGVFSINIVVASGIVYALAGIYFGLKQEGINKLLEFQGYLRCGGKVDVLGIISVSVELYLGFGYKKETRDSQSLAIIFGIARLTVEISILFFSASVQLEYSTEFVQEGADPTFRDALTMDDWTLYCDAFSLNEGI